MWKEALYNFYALAKWKWAELHPRPSITNCKKNKKAVKAKSAVSGNNVIILRHTIWKNGPSVVENDRSFEYTQSNIHHFRL